jgi:hypothetical protein
MQEPPVIILTVRLGARKPVLNPPRLDLITQGQARIFFAVTIFHMLS